MKELSYQHKILFQSACKAAKPLQKFLIETICHIESQTVDVKLVYPALYAGEDMLNDFIVPEVQLDKVEVSLPALIPQSVIVVGVAAEVYMEPVLIA